MGLKTTTDFSVLKGKVLVGYNFNHGNEYVLHLQDNDTGKIERIRVPYYMKDLMEQFYWLAQEEALEAA
jgi:hypothetical protein